MVAILAGLPVSQYKDTGADIIRENRGALCGGKVRVEPLGTRCLAPNVDSA